MKNTYSNIPHYTFFIFLVTVGYIQPFLSQTLFQRAYNNTEAKDFPIDIRGIEKINNNQFVKAGSTYSNLIEVGLLERVDSLGNIVWARKYDDGKGGYLKFHDLQHTQDGHLVVGGFYLSDLGADQDCYVSKLDINGNIIWSKTFGFGTDDWINTITEDSFGNIYCAGVLDFGGFGMIAKINGSNGELIWQKQTPFSLDCHLFSMCCSSLGELMVVGMIRTSLDYSTGSTDALLLKLDTNGNMKWSKTFYGSTTESIRKFNKIIALPNQEFVILGAEDGNKQIIWKIDSTGNVLQKRISDGNPRINNRGLQLSEDSTHLYIYGECNSDPNINAFLSEFNLNLQHIWSKEFGGCHDDGFTDLVLGNESTIYLSGYTRSYGRDESSPFDQFVSNDYLIRADTSGYTSCYDYESNVKYITDVVHLDFFTTTLENGNAVITTFNTDVQFLTIHDSQVCVSTNPKGVKFGATDTIICVGECISFQDKSVIHTGVYSSPTPIMGGGNVPNYTTYTWTFSEATFSSGTNTLQNPTNICYNTPGKHSVKLLVNMGCRKDSIELENYITVLPKNPVISISGDTTICLGDTTILTASGADTYKWIPNTYLNVSNQAEVHSNPNQTTTYTIIGTTSKCGTAMKDITISILPIPENTLPSELIILPSESVTLNATGGETYTWSPVIDLSCSDCSDPVATPHTTTIYCVEVIDSNSCTSSKCVKVNLDIPCGELFVPNSFSPNGDNNNDLLEVKINAACIEDYNLQIFDRWGEKVFESTKISNSWDGKFNGKELDNAVFAYHLKIKTIDSTKRSEKKGNVSIIR